MQRFFSRSVLFLLLFSAMVSQPWGAGRGFGGGEVFAQDADVIAAKEAFEVAKELGTADAWNAFLASYPTGFYADMARAYLKKAGGQSEPAAVPVVSSGKASERQCSERAELRSQSSSEPTKITFVNKSGMYRAFLWIDFEGNLQDYGGLNSGEQITFDTYRTHPWMVATGPGDCLQIFLPAAEPATVELFRLDADNPKPSTPPRAKPTEAKKKPLACGKNYKLRNGECVLLQNCGKNAYRSAEGDCYCKKGYQLRNGKCVWRQDKQGFEVEPWKKPGCKTWQAQCNKGNGNACRKYEETCQVN